MAFIKKDWKCGDTITADDLNRLENGVEEALDGGSVDCGYSCTEERVTLTDESVTTAKPSEEAPFATGFLTYSELITADTIKVTFNGTEYTCNKVFLNDVYLYGDASEQGPDFSTYPFVIDSNGISNRLYTETAGAYQVKIEAFEETIETSECFEKARGYSCTEGWATLAEESVTTTLGEENYAEGRLSYSSEINADTIKVTFNGAEYTCQKDGYGAYGAHWNNEASAYDWSEYPFVIYWLSEFTQNYLDTETAGTYQVKIEEPSIEADVTECFKKAAIHATKEAMKEVLQPLVLIHNSASTLSATFETIRDAYLAGRSVLLDPIVNSKSYYSMVSLVLTDYRDPTAGGEIVFGGETTQTFTASTASDYPTKVTS